MKCFIVEFTDEFFNRMYNDMFDYMRYSPSLQLEDSVLKSILHNIELLKFQ